MLSDVWLPAALSEVEALFVWFFSEKDTGISVHGELVEP
jgi:hypothetical protein